MDWDALRVFLAVVRTGSLRGAAKSLSVTHATARRAVDALEANLGARLFERSRRGLHLTQAGEELVGSAERMEEEALAIRRRISGRDRRPAGPLRVSAPPSLALTLLAEPFAAFARAHPEVSLQVQISNRFFDLSRFEADVTLRVAHRVEEDVVGRRLVQYRKAVYATPAYFEARPQVRIGDGAGAEWLGWTGSDGPEPWILESAFPNAPVAHRFSDSLLHREAAARGLGLASLPCFIGDPDERLVRAPGVAPVEDRSIWLLLHRDLRRVSRVRVFVDFIARQVQERRALLLGDADAAAADR